MSKFGHAFCGYVKSGIFAVVGIVLAGMTILGSAGCNMNDGEIKKTVLELANDMVKENAIVPDTIKAIKVTDMSLVQESVTKRSGYAHVEFKSMKTQKTEKLRFDVKVTGFLLSDQMIEIQASNGFEVLKLMSLDSSSSLFD